MSKIENRDCQNVEFKSSLNDKYLEWICGFANAQGAVSDDYITIWNGGMLPPNYSVEKLMQPHESHPRNRLMANVFYLAGFIEAWGRGYKKIREGFEGAGLPMPKIENAYGGVKVTFQRNNVNSTQTGSHTHPDGMSEGLSKRLSERLSKELSESAYSIFLMIVSDNHINRKVLAEKTGISTTAVQKHLNKLKDLGLIKRIGSAKYGYWEIIENERNDCH